MDEYSMSYQYYPIQNQGNQQAMNPFNPSTQLPVYSNPPQQTAPFKKPYLNTKFNKPKIPKIPQVFECSLCQVKCTSQDLLDKHLQGKKHAKTLNGNSISSVNTAGKFGESPAGSKNLTCDLCNITCMDDTAYQMHIAGKKHLKRTQMDSSQVKSSSFNPEKGSFYCDLCSVRCNTEEMFTNHMLGNKHLKKKSAKEIMELKMKKDPSVYCDVCCMLLDPSLMINHRDGLKHKSKFEKLEAAKRKSETVVEPDESSCKMPRLE